MAHDPRMDFMPLFVSFPRTGAHWINCVMELYFDRPRLREGRATFLDRTRTDWMWFHDHDIDLSLSHPSVLFLFRDPVETIFSNLAYDSQAASRSWRTRLLGSVSTQTPNRDEVCQRANHYRQHCEKYLLSAHKAETVVRHENFKSDRAREFKKICSHFNQPFDHVRMEHAFATVTPEALVAKTGDTPAMGKHMLAPDYRSHRQEFTHQWRDFIEKLVITPALRPFFAKETSGKNNEPTSNPTPALLTQESPIHSP